MKKDSKYIDNRTHIHIFGGEKGNWLYPFKKIIYFMITIVVIAHAVGWIGEFVYKDRHIYNKCTEKCASNGFEGFKLGNDYSESSCIVNEIDHTECIENCNLLYVKISS